MSRKILNNKLKQQIAELVATGLDVVQACKKLNNIITPQSVYKEQIKDTDFAALMDTAYQSFLMAKFAELNEVANLTASQAYPHLEFKEAEATLKRRHDTLKYTLAKLASQLSKRWETTTKVEHSGSIQGITVVMDSYYTEKVELTDTKPTIN